MLICGIIAEYNPFHRGHERHIALTRQASGAELIVCAMSGFFMQRGEPAVFDKWTRAACALMCGADAVIELPLLSAVQSAQGFASGGVKTLAAAGVDSLCFGAETDDLSLMQKLSELLYEEDTEYKEALRRALNAGHSFPKARMAAADAPPEASQPGALLGIEYLNALRTHPHIRPYVVKREGAAYHSDNADDYLASATAIRKALADGRTEKALKAMPKACAAFVQKQLNAGLVPVFPAYFEAPLLHMLRLLGPSYIAQLPDVTEGLENRIYAAAKSCRSRDELIARVKTKRYTYARISRILACALLSITQKMVSAHNAAPAGSVRILGVKNGDVLSALAKAARVPLITSAAKGYSAQDAASGDVWALSQSAAPFCESGRDFSQRLLNGFL